MHLGRHWTELMMGSFCMQGLGLQLRPAQAGRPAFREALMEVLSNPKYAKAAKAMSVKIRGAQEHSSAGGCWCILPSPQKRLACSHRASADNLAFTVNMLCFDIHGFKCTTGQSTQWTTGDFERVLAVCRLD